MIGFKTTLFLWGELVNLALSRDDGLGARGLRVLIDPENRSAQEAATASPNPHLPAGRGEEGNAASLLKELCSSPLFSFM